jgi:hypothetical protein
MSDSDKVLSEWLKKVLSKWETHFLFCDLILVVFVTLVFVSCVELFGLKEVINDVLNGNRSNIYAALVSIFGSLFGFVMTTMSIITTWTGRDKMEELRRKSLYPQLWLTFHSTIIFIALATLVSIIALIFDRDGSPKSWIWHFLLFLVLISCMRIYRCVWILEQLIEMIAGPLDPLPEE